MSFQGDPLAFYGRNIIEDYHASLTAKLPLPSTAKTGSFDISDETLRFFPHKKVGILGAGVGGLYTALILDSLDIEYEILEASDRAGGRLSTYKFPGGQKYDYYDAGAMRYPLPKKDEQGQYKNGIMKRLAELIIYPPLNQGSDRLEDKLVPYHFEALEGPNLKPGFYYFNGVRERISDKPGSFHADQLGVAPSYIKAGTDAIHNDVIEPFARLLIADIEQGKKEGWRVAMANDSYSLRAYMSFKYIPSVNLDLPPQHLHHKVVNWCELLQSSTKWYDRALTEEVFESLAFARIGGTDFGDVDWKCFDGGSEVLTKKMAEVINQKGERIQFGKRVMAIGQSHKLTIIIPSDFPMDKLPSGATESKSGNNTNAGTKTIDIPNAGVAVSVHNESEKRVYSHVISTLPLPVLRTIGMKDAEMNVKQKNALRQLQYGPSIKIAMRFKEPWWTTKLNIVGGQSFTDLPIRTIVYPSYGVDSDTPSTVLIASYCWTTDAERLGSLATPDKTGALKEMVLHNLAEAHGAPITYKFLHDQFVDMNVKDWSHDPHTMGAFAFFGPGDFEDLYSSLTYPAVSGRLHFAGEAISTRHAWVVGALDSAWRAVHEYLSVTKQDDKMQKFKELWGENVEWASPPGQPSEKDKPSRLLLEHLGLTRQAVLAGEIRYADY
ncbi:amine oxidase [Pisolithus orientalis]|uniref:amine oxidase n=1 Tax=Pisolithus orientalis TaxID=936130 RepID=UPI002224B9E0|nr:amine oxidase [Pisolithus orientalis]KAI5990294.1 amine oxidase [Pisolithus orientalis]